MKTLFNNQEINKISGLPKSRKYQRIGSFFTSDFSI